MKILLKLNEKEETNINTSEDSVQINSEKESSIYFYFFRVSLIIVILNSVIFKIALFLKSI